MSISIRGRRGQRRFDCPLCGYKNSYVETNGKTGRMGWCAACRDRDAIAAYLANAYPAEQRRAASAPPLPDPATRLEAVATAGRIWGGGGAITDDSPAGRYLHRRGLAAMIGTPALRYRADTPHPGGGRHLAMLGLIQDVAGRPVGVHRTYLAADGGKAELSPQKASKGINWGGAIRLHPLAAEIVIGEGIETAASAGLLLGLPAWAAISSGNLAAGLVLPPEVRSIIIAADDDGDDAQGRNPGLDAAREARCRWQAEGRDVQIVKPDQPGHDFNDMILGRHRHD